MKNKENAVNTTQNKILLVFSVVVILLISLLTINWNNASASTEKLDSNAAETCGSCKGYNKETVYNQNIAFMREAALDYFTDERLPQSVNSKKTITLEEMIEKRLLYSIVDSNGNKCSLTDSYVEVTKYENEYIFKINLSCSDISDYIYVHKGCYTYCENNNCVKPEDDTPETPDEQIYEYEYKKITSCVMTDWSEWSEWSTTREEITDSNYKREEIKTETVIETSTVEEAPEIKTTFNCDQYEGYELLGNLCVRTDSSLLEEEADLNPTTYNCKKYEGYILEGTKCIKKDTTTDEKPADKNPTTYNCDRYPGYRLVGDKCVIETSEVEEKPADKNPTTYNCDRYPGYRLVGDKCIIETSEVEEKPADENPATYNCNRYPGYTLVGEKCIIETTDTKDATKVTSYNCNNYPGYTLVGDKCVLETQVPETISATPHYNTKTIQEPCKEEVCSTKQVLDCSSGTCVMKEEKTCTYVDSMCDKEIQYIDYYTCPSNYDHVSEKVCQRMITTTDTKDATMVESYNCDNYPGYSLDSTGKKCTKTITDTKDADKDETTYNCDKYPGFTLEGNKCIRTIPGTEEKPADEDEPTYNCDKYPGFTLEGNKCIRTMPGTEEKPADEDEPTYNCDKYDGYTLEGNKCVKEVETIDEKPADEDEPSYNCDKYEGYTLVGNKCIKPVCEVCTREADKVEENICREGFTLTEDNKCIKEEEKEVEVTYYRYSTRSCEGGSTETKWSLDKNDVSLKAQGYKRTGRTRLLVVNK